MATRRRVQIHRSLLAASATGLLALAAVLPAQADYSNTVMSLDPVGYWRLNEPVGSGTATNIGSALATGDAAYIASPTLQQQPGPMGTDPAVLFDGASQYASVPYNAAFNPPGSFTVSFWAKKTAAGSSTVGAIFSRDPASSGQNGWLFFAGNGDGKWWFRTYTNNVRASVISGNPIVLNQWTHVVGVHDATDTGTNYLYLDGVLAAAPLGKAGYNPNASYPMFFAAWADTANPPVPGFYFPGLLDEIALFDKALTPAQVQGLYGSEPPTITQQPQAPGPLYDGMAFSLSVAVNGNPPFAYQWRTNGTAIPGKTKPDLVVTNLTMANSGEYTVVINNDYGSATSSPVQITVQTGPPIFTAQPQAAQCFAGGSATFSVSALGSAPLSYQWYFSTPTATNLIAGATSSSYAVANVGAGDVGNYSAQVINPYGNTNSAKAALTLVPVTGYAAEVVESGPVSYWRFSETTGTTAVDYMAGKNGTDISIVFTNGPNPTSGYPGPFAGLEADNRAYAFNGSNSVVNLPTSFALNRSAYSVVAWVQATPGATNAKVIMGQAGSWSLRLSALTGFSTLQLINGPSTTALDGNFPVDDGSWHQVVAVYDGTKEYLYVDGILDASVAATGLVPASTSLTTIGWQGGTTPRWNGSLDEVAVYNRGLSGPEVANLFAMATSTTVLAPQIGAEPVSQTVYAGQPASFSVAALGGAPYTYQWKRYSTNLPGATKRVLTIPSAQPTDVGTYSVTVNNTVGPAVDSQVAGLTVLPPPYIDVGGAGVIGDTTLTTVAGVARVPVDGVNWRAAGGGGDVYSSLTSPAFTVPATHVNGGMVTLKFTHRYNLELGWDGGAVYVSKNGAAATYVDASAFTANGYAGPIPSSVFTGGESVFNNISAGWGTGTLIESVATLGPVNQGDTIAITFKGGWDSGYNQATDLKYPGAPGPGWEIGTVQLSDSSTAVFSSVNFVTDGPAGFTVVSDPGLGGPWDYLRSTFKFEINGDTLAADRFKPDIAGSVIDITGADLSVVLLAGSLDAGDSFALFDLSGGTTLRGSYRSIALPPGTWNVSNLGVNGTIVYVAYPPIRSFDVNSGSSPTQYGYSALNETLNGASYGITVATTVVSDGTSGYADRGVGYSDLLRDLFFANGTATPPVLTFNLTGLLPNTRYAINMCSFNGGASQRVSKWYRNAVAGVPVATHLTEINGDNAYFTLDLTSDSTGKITFVGTSDDPTGKSVAVNGLTIALATPSDVFSVNFYAAGGGVMGAANVANVENLKLNPSLAAGLGDWSSTSWRNYTVPWNPSVPDAPVTLESSRGSKATFTLVTCRNGGPYVWDAPRTTLLNDGNGNLMDARVNSTLDANELFDMVVSNIPFARYDVIFYIGATAAQYGDGKGKIVFNGAPERDFTVKPGPFDGTFTEMVDATNSGNYVVYKMVTGSSFTAQTWGMGPGTGFNHIGPAGFQIREVTVTLPIPTFVNGVPTFTGVASVSGFTYWLAYKNNLTDPDWNRIGAGTPGTGGNLILTDPVAPYPAHRFYRLEVQ